MYEITRDTKPSLAKRSECVIVLNLWRGTNHLHVHNFYCYYYCYWPHLAFFPPAGCGTGAPAGKEPSGTGVCSLPWSIPSPKPPVCHFAEFCRSNKRKVRLNYDTTRTRVRFERRRRAAGMLPPSVLLCELSFLIDKLFYRNVIVPALVERNCFGVVENMAVMFVVDGNGRAV